MIDNNYRNSNIEFFLNWLDNCFSTLIRVYNPSSFKKKSSDTVEYYRINDIKISFFTDKIIDIIRKQANVQNPKGNTVKEMREFLEDILSKLENVKDRYEENYPGIEFKFKVRTKYIPNFLINFLIEHAESNEETTQKDAIRISDHNTGIGMAGELKKFIDYMTIVECYQCIEVCDIDQIFNCIIKKLRAMDDKTELSFGKLKNFFGKMLESRLLSIEKNYFISKIMDEDNYEERIEEMLLSISYAKYEMELTKEMRKNMGNIEKIKKIFRKILNSELESLAEGEKYADDSLIITSPIHAEHMRY